MGAQIDVPIDYNGKCRPALWKTFKIQEVEHTQEQVHGAHPLHTPFPSMDQNFLNYMHFLKFFVKLCVGVPTGGLVPLPTEILDPSIALHWQIFQGAPIPNKGAKSYQGIPTLSLMLVNVDAQKSTPNPFSKRQPKSQTSKLPLMLPLGVGKFFPQNAWKLKKLDWAEVFVSGALLWFIPLPYNIRWKSMEWGSCHRTVVINQDATTALVSIERQDL